MEIVFGSIAALRGKTADTVITGVPGSAIAVPGYVLAVLLVLVLSLKQHWFPTGGCVSPTTAIAEHVRRLVLPVIRTGIPVARSLREWPGTPFSVPGNRNGSERHAPWNAGPAGYRDQILRNFLNPVVSSVGLCRPSQFLEGAASTTSTSRTARAFTNPATTAPVGLTHVCHPIGGQTSGLGRRQSQNHLVSPNLGSASSHLPLDRPDHGSWLVASCTYLLSGALSQAGEPLWTMTPISL